MDNFDPCNVFLVIATNIPQRLKTGFVLQGHIYIINIHSTHTYYVIFFFFWMQFTMINHLKALLLLGSVVVFMLLMKIINIFHFLESIFLWLKHCQETY